MRYRKESQQTQWLAALFLMTVFCGTSYFAYGWWNHEAVFEGMIVRIHWDYSQDILEYRAVERECSTYGCYPEHSYNHRIDTDCTTTTSRDSEGRTTTKRSCDTDYPYTINDWVTIRTDHAYGEGNLLNPYYPESVLVRAYGSSECPLELYPYGNMSPMFGCQRIGSQYPNQYMDIQTFDLEEDFVGYNCFVSYGRWTELSIEDVVSGTYFDNRNKINCTSIVFDDLESWYTND